VAAGDETSVRVHPGSRTQRLYCTAMPIRPSSVFRKRLSWGALALTLAAARVAAAQGPVPAGALGGRVVDQAGAPVRHAQVVAREDRTGAERGAAVGADGRYTLRPLATGTYTLRVRAVGYQPVTRPLVALAAGEVREVDIRLAPAATALTQQVVTATRSPVSIAAVPGAVTVLTRGQIEAQTKTVPRLGPALAQLVPGLGAATENLSNFGQNIRGRAILVLIDGVPQSTARNVSRDFVNIDPAMVDRVEVVRGATSVYGNGATGGVINIITRRGDADGEGGG
jgi:iron complex outermembrane receptor protein